MIFKREIERKFVIENESYEEAFSTLACKGRVVLNATSFDTYWAHRGVDFIRLRDNSREITVKVTDKGTVIDRIEENVEVFKDAMPAAKRLLTLLFGDPSCVITKKFSVFEIETSPGPGTAFKAILCLYEVEGDPLKRLFFEVEAETIGIVDHILHDLKGRFQLHVEKRSLYQIFVGSNVRSIRKAK